jgi:hypothetical protein
MWDRRDNQEVGLEAAILERVRNSSLVKWSCADDVTGLKHDTEAAGSAITARPSGEALEVQAGGSVGERSGASEAAGEPSRGRAGSENAGMSSERRGRSPSAESPRVPGEGSSAQG